jgi:hypothetical protein
MDQYSKDISEAKNALSSIMTALNQENLIIENRRKERKELEADTAKFREETLALKASTEKARSEDAGAKTALLEVQSNKQKEEGLLVDALKKHEDAEKDLADFVGKANAEISRLNGVKATTLEDTEVKKEQANKEIRSLEATKQTLIDAIAVKEKVLSDLSLQESKQLEKIGDNKSFNEAVLKDIENSNQILRRIKNDIIDQETLFEKNKIVLAGIETVIIEKETEKKNIQTEINTLEEGRTTFVQAKMVLQKDREELANRELFIMNKYEQAGVDYKDRLTTDAQLSVGKTAELEQRSADLDKREAFLRTQYEKAGVDYL